MNHLFTQEQNVAFWLDSEVQSSEIEVCSSLNSGHSVVHSGLPFVTQQRHLVHPESEAKGNHFGPAFKLEAEHATQTGGPVLISPAVWASLIGT